MEGFKKKPLSGKGKTEKIVFDRFTLFGTGGDGVLAAAESLNCDCADGTLKTGLGILPFTLQNGDRVAFGIDKEVDTVCYIESLRAEDTETVSEYLLGVTGDGVCYSFDPAKPSFLQALTFGVGPNVAAATTMGKDMRTVVAAETGIYCFRYGTFTQMLNVEHPIRAVCACQNRIFVAAKPYTLFYMNPTEWVFEETLDDGGRLTLPTGRGEVASLQNFKDVVYIFFERGIMRLIPDGAAREFKLEPVLYDGEFIFGNSVSVCGDVMMFLAADGVYRFDGKTAKRVCDEMRLRPLRIGQICTSAVCGNDYLVRYLCEDGTRKTAVVHSDGKGGYYTSDFEGLKSSNRKALCRRDSYIQQICVNGNLPAYEKYSFASKGLDFGVQGNKTLKSLRFEGAGSFTCGIRVGNRYREEKLIFSDGEAYMKAWEKGKEFQLILMPDTGSVIRKITAEVAFA